MTNESNIIIICKYIYSNINKNKNIHSGNPNFLNA